MKIIKWLDNHLEECFLALALAIIVVVLTLQIIFRKLLGNSLAWSEELCRYLFMWSGMLTLSFTLHNGTAVKTDLVMDLFPKIARKWIQVLVQIMLLILFLVMTKVSAGVVPTITQSGTAIPISRQWIFLSMPVGFALAWIRSLQNIIKLFKTTKEKEGL